MNQNPFENALRQMDKACKYLKLSKFQTDRLRTPEKIISVNFPLKMDSGEEKIFHGFRIQHNSALGPYKGGIRFHQQVDMNEVKALAFWMAIKCAVADLPLGGGKGGVEVDPKTLSLKELERLSKAYARAIAPDIGPYTDIPAPDVNTNSQIMKWMVEEYIKVQSSKFKVQRGERNKLLAAFTGKPVDFGGSLGRNEATGRGGYYVLKAVLSKLNSKLKTQNSKLTVAVQGFGNVGYHFAKFAYQEGMRVIALSDSKGAIVVKDIEKDSLNPDLVLSCKKEKGSLNKCYCIGSVCDLKNGRSISNSQLLELPVDILVPAALENQITSQNAAKIKAKVVLELANGPTSPEADDILYKKGITVVPDVLANSGGVTVSYFEWKQNMDNEHWGEEKVNQMLKRQISTAFDQIWTVAQSKSVDLRTAAFITAVSKLVSKIH